MEKRIYPPFLYPGDCIGLVAPASPVTEGVLKQCVEVLEEAGYRVLVGSMLKQNLKRDSTEYLAGDAVGRASEVNRMFWDRRVRAILCVRGGYGSAQVLPYLDYRGIRANPKIFMGYSDITAMHSAIQKRSGLITFHGPMAGTNMIRRNIYEWKGVCQLICAGGNMCEHGFFEFQNPPGEEIEILNKEIFNEKACVKGELTGGNLSVLLRLTGTKYQPDYKDKILFLEEVGETVPRIHMNLIQLEQTGILHQVRAILLGDFSDCGPQAGELLQTFFGYSRIPVLANIRSDHRKDMGTLPLGAMCEIRTGEKRIFIFNE